MQRKSVEIRLVLVTSPVHLQCTVVVMTKQIIVAEAMHHANNQPLETWPLRLNHLNSPNYLICRVGENRCWVLNWKIPTLTLLRCNYWPETFPNILLNRILLPSFLHMMKVETKGTYMSPSTLTYPYMAANGHLYAAYVISTYPTMMTTGAPTNYDMKTLIKLIKHCKQLIALKRYHLWK